MRLCAGEFKVKTAHFRLPSASQKRACLSSLITIHILAVATDEEVCSPIWEKKIKTIDEQAENYLNPLITTKKYRNVNIL